jgi:hypothetical protein
MYKALCIAAVLVATIAVSSTSKSGATPAPFAVAACRRQGQGLKAECAYLHHHYFHSHTEWLVPFVPLRNDHPAQYHQQCILGCECGLDGRLRSKSIERLLLHRNGDATAQPFFWNAEGFSGAPVMLQAKAGTPITYAVTQTGTIGNGQYSLYYTLEHLE